MSFIPAAALPYPPLPVALPRLVLEKQRDATTEAVLRYFDAQRWADISEQANAFDHLIAICWTATRPYFLRSHYGLDRYTSTREWMQEWLLTTLAPDRDKSRQELLAAADKDEFRYLGRLCRLRLLDAIRAEGAAKCTRPPHLSLDATVSEDGASLYDYYGTARHDAPSSLATHNSFEDFLGCVSNIFRAISANREELAKLDLLDGLRAILANAEQLEKPNFRRFQARVIQSLAATRRVSPQAACAYMRRFHRIIARELEAGNRAVRALFLELQTDPPAYRLMEAPAFEGAELADFQTSGCA